MNWILAKSEKPYSWGHCDEKFNQKQNLNQHEMVKTGEKTLFMQVSSANFFQHTQTDYKHTQITYLALY